MAELIGAQRLHALRSADAAALAEGVGKAPAPSLPPAAELPGHLLSIGRALLARSLPQAMRATLIQRFGWSEAETEGGEFRRHAEWAAHAVCCALGHDSALQKGATLGARSTTNAGLGAEPGAGADAGIAAGIASARGA